MLKRNKGDRRQLKWKKIPVLMLAVFLACFMAGCRQSPVLEQVLYTQDATEVDQDQEWMEQAKEGKETEHYHDQLKEDAKTQRDQESGMGVFDETAAAEGVGQSVTYSEYGASNLTVDGAKEDRSGENAVGGEGLEEVDEEEPDDENDDDDENQDDEEDVKSEDDPWEEEGDPSNPEEVPSEDSEKDSVTDDDGEEKEIPDATLVAAPGIGAEIVEMVAGNGYLAASSESFVSNPIASAIFKDVASGSVAALWSGSGAAPIADVNTLLAIEGLDMCFYVSGQSFTEEQVAQLKESGISCIALPVIDSVDHLKEAVMAVATAFEEETGGTSIQVAQNYAAFTDAAMGSVSNGDFFRYSVYLSDWRSDISYTFRSGNFPGLPVDTGGAGAGVAVGWSEEKAELVSTFMNCAGVVNLSSQRKADGREGFYITPMFHQFFPLFSDDSYGYFDTVGAGYDAFVSINTTCLGSTFYPAVVVKNEEIRTAIAGPDGIPDGADGGNWYWQYHGGWNTSTTASKGGYYNPETGDMFYGSIVGTYQIFVNPSGVGDWAEGCLESPLEAYWIAAKFGNGTTSWDAMQGKVLEFYNQFYGVDARGLLSTILKE